MADRGFDVSHLHNALRTLRDVARFMTKNEEGSELRTFYASLLVRCIIIVEQGGRVQLGELHARFLSQLESKITFDVLEAIPTHRNQVPSDSRLEAFTQRWKDLQEQPDDNLKLELIRKHLNLGSSREEHEELICILDEIEKEILSQDSQGPSQWRPDVLGPRKRVEEPSYAVQNASISLYEALSRCKSCSCTTEHYYSVQLRLRTYREIFSDIDFDLFLCDQDAARLVEARVCVRQESRVNFAVASATPGKLMKIQPSTQKIHHLCQLIKKFRLEKGCRLNLEVTRGSLFKYRGFDRTLLIDTDRSPISLHKLLESRSLSFSEKNKRILAVLVSSAVVHFQDTPWLQPTWSSADIYFFFTDREEIPLRPYIRCQLFDQNNRINTGISSDEIGADDLDPDDYLLHPCPTLITLAIMLMEIYFASPLEVLAARYDVDLGNTEETRVAMRYFNADTMFNACRGEIPRNSGYLYALERCLDSSIWEDEHGTRLDHSTLRFKVYEEVVRPLETELDQTFNSIDINALDEYAKNLDIANWGRTIQSENQRIRKAEFQNPLQFSHQTRLYNDKQVDRNRVTAPLYLGPEAAQKTNATTEYKVSTFFDDEIIAEADTNKKRERYQKWRSDYHNVYSHFIPEHVLSKPVRIAVLDTGIDLTHPNLEARNENIKAQYNWHLENSQHGVYDENGHGTFVAGLLLDYAPNAEMYVAKISEQEPANPKTIARAIDHAASTWCVDIISMSFGFPSHDIDGYHELKRSIMNAYSRDILLFAAASNSGGRHGRSYPAAEPTVIAVHATDAFGNRSIFSPSATIDDINIATIGEAVESAWPVHLCEDETNPTYITHKSGTSYATPIAAGIAAFMLQYARVHLPDMADALKTQKRMKALLRKASQVRDGYYFVHLSLYDDSLFGMERAYIDHIFKEIMTT